MSRSVREDILAAAPGALPDLLTRPDVDERLQDQWAAFQTLLREQPDAPIYAVTTLTGHRDREGVFGDPRAINQAVADSHFFEPTSPVEPRLWRLVGLCKLVHLSLGGSPVRPELFQALRDVQDSDFTGRLDLEASYSSGDVLPACQWAMQALGAARIPVGDLGPGEMIALINGSFVHLGGALWSLERLENALARDLTQSRRTLTLMASVQQQTGAQAPVSFRAADQGQSALRAMMDYCGAVIDRLLGAPSGNPLFHQGPPARFESQASFMSCQLAVAQSAVIEAVLALGWIISRRLQHLCAAFDDGAGADNPIRLIQHPKKAQAILELMRMRNGARPFASGGATSEGIEDFWSRGAHLSLAVAEAAEALNQMLHLEADALARLEGVRA